ncbi:cardiolipin synthase [Brevibacterium sp. HMSC24B04]|uniref:cardiolipin synthase n=1 Tax=Brevibacterium sp. HMSC24B04 TaxID=1581060 RepID=UPI0008A5AA04|nr:cardiolipin synthase [Brevibacterium sp. HMSC24B04]OFT91984.1 cardiolipin synthase A [Brevibacterium sp. HMSC24B04]
MSFWTVMWVIWLVVSYTIKIIAVGVVPENRRPGASMGWLMAILFIPLIGVPLFIMFGSPYVNDRRQRIQAEVNQLLEKGTKDVPDWPEGYEPARDFAQIVQLNRHLTGLPMVDARKLSMSTDYRQVFHDMADAIDAAESYVHVEIYIMSRDAYTEPFFQALGRAAQRGVNVRVLLDHIGSRKYDGFRDMQKWFDSVGIDWELMLPFLPLQGKMRRIDLRNHRKLVVIDGRVGFMGSQNLIESAYGSQKNREAGRHWNDLWVKMSGEVVAELEAVFATDWYSEREEVIDIRPYDFDGRPVPEFEGKDAVVQLVPSGPGFKTEPNLRCFTSLMYLAEKRLSIVSPYFVPDETIKAAIITAAHRGVEVELFVSEKADQFMVEYAQSSYYDNLLEAGVRIYRLPKPQILHTKCFIIDDDYAVFGSSNMDMRSFSLNYEISLMCAEGDFVSGISNVVEEYRTRCTELTLDEWRERGLFRRYLESLFRLTSALQ